MENADIDLDGIVEKLLKIKGFQPNKEPLLSKTEVLHLCSKAKQIFLDQPVLLELTAPIKICGNINGHYQDLLRIFELGGFPPEANYLFLGNYVDKGSQSLDTICLLFAYKIKYPEDFFLLRGNHESSTMNRIYGLYHECKAKYSIKLWKVLNEAFDCLPIAAILNNKIFCVHGGLSPELTNLDQIAEIQRPISVPDDGLLCDLLWADPDKDIKGWEEISKGVSYIFGPGVVEGFLIKHDLHFICRSHQVVEDGYEFFADKGLVTVFSASNYCGEFDNSSAIMSVDESCECSFQILKPKRKEKKH